MDIRVLRYFLALANTETISGAAEVLHTTQPNLSRQLSELEKEAGRPLFTRGSRKITLTEEGMFLRKRAQEIVDEKRPSAGFLSEHLSRAINSGSAFMLQPDVKRKWSVRMAWL